MGTKELGWSGSWVLRARFLSLALSVSSLVVLISAGTAYAVDQKKARDKIVDLNKQALLSYEAKDFEAAKELLTKALKEAKQSGLEDDKMTARTYLHLGAVYFSGYQDQATALQNFTLAKKIRPDIQLTPSIETPELKAAFDQATADAEPTPPTAPEPTRASRPLPAARPSAASELDGAAEPELPTSMSAPLMCSTPEEAQPGKELSIRCAVKPGVNAKSVELHYRAPGAESYQALPMHRSAKGWYLATIPGHVMKGASLQVYYDARDGSDNELATNGQIDSPSVIEIRKRGGGGGGAKEADIDPLERIKKQQRLEEYESGLHRRREGAVWFGLGGGLGWGYAPAGNLEWEKDIKVSAITTTAGLFQAVVDAGYMWSDNFSLGVQLRIEYIRQDQVTTTGRSGAPTVYAPALFLRPMWFFDITSGGNFQLSLSANAGGGYVRFPVKPVVRYHVVNNETAVDPSQTIAKTDTRPVGVVLLGPGAGLVYHMSRHFGIALDARLLTGFPNFGVALEGNVSLQIAFGGKSGPASEGEEEEEGDAGNNDAPTPSDSPGNSEEE